MEIYKESIKLDNTDFKIRCFINCSKNNHDDFIKVHPHWHDMIEILFVIKGSATQQINKNVFEIAKGDIVIIKGQEIHSTYSMSSHYTEIFVIQFDESIFNPYEANTIRILEAFSRKTRLSFAIKSNDFPGSKILDNILNVKKEYELKKPAWEFAAISGCCEIISSCIRNYSKKENAVQVNSKVKKDLQKVFDFVDDNFDRKITLGDISKKINYSIPHFCRIFKRSTGMSFVEYLNHYRIKIAIDLLKKGLPVTETACMCGFLSINSFIRTFKKYTGISPGKFNDSANYS